MKYSCPKCAAELDQDITEIPDKGISAKCPECKATYDIIKESFGGRAIRKADEIYCAKCGAGLSHTLHCGNCGIGYPDYFVAETHEAKRRRQAKKRWESLKAFQFSFATSPQISNTGYAPDSPRATVTQTPTSTPFKAKGLLAVIVCLVVVVVVSAVGAKLYNNHKVEENYKVYFFKTLHGIKLGTDMSNLISSKISNEWKEKLDSGRSGDPRPTPDDIANLNNIKDTTNRFMQQLKEPPAKYTKAHSSIMGLYDVYNKMHTQTVASQANSLPTYTTAVNAANDEFSKASAGLKAALDSDMTEELKKAKTKYKALRDF